MLERNYLLKKLEVKLRLYTETEGQRKIHLTVLLLLVRSRLIPIAELDVFLAKSMDGGRNTMWVEFSIEFLRNALLERITLSSDTPKVIEYLKMIGEGRSQTGSPIHKNLFAVV